MIKILLKQIKQYKKHTALSILFTALEVIIELSIPLLIATIIDEGILSYNMKNIYIYGAAMVVLAVFSLISGILSGKFAATASSGFSANIKNTMYENIQTFSFSDIDHFTTPSLITRLTTDVSNVQTSFQVIIRLFIRAPLNLIVALTMSIFINPHVAVVFCVAAVLLGLVLGVIIKKAMPLFTDVFKRYDLLNNTVQENIVGIRVVKSFVREGFEENKFDRAIMYIYKLFVKAESMVSIVYPAMMLAIQGSIIAISWISAKMITSGNMTTGELTSLFSYATSILMALLLISIVFVLVSISIASARRVHEVITWKSTLSNPENPVMEIPSASISFEGVSFSYSHKECLKNVLTDVNININPGETIGILGGTGSSKSSLVNLIPRLYDVNSGSVKVGGIDVRKYDLETLRDGIAVVLQKNQLFSGSILDNLKWGNENASLEDCIAVCKITQADGFVQKFPDKYDTHVDQGGANLSGGQRQRLCIARALLKNPKILILDDSTSAVDTATDLAIREALKTQLPNVTKLIIAQRISSIMSSDKIILLNDGRIEAFSTHEDLIESNEMYRLIYETQLQEGGGLDG